MTAQDEARAKKPFRWTFPRSALLILVAMVLGQIVGRRIETFGFADWIVIGFSISALAFVALQFWAVRRFFTTMQTGVALVVLVLVAVGAGVLVPQIENFEDATERVPSIADVPDAVFYAYLKAPQESDVLEAAPAERIAMQAQIDAALTGLDADQRARVRKYREEYQKFRWAEGYFLYHLVHPYGIGMPEVGGLPPNAIEGLKRYGQKYGSEERSNREKTMKAAFGGKQKAVAIGTLIRAHEETFRAWFDVATRLDLNRAYKSHWFATLLGLLFVGVAFNTFKGAPSGWLSARKVGYVTVHAGVMLLLLGGAYSKLKTVRGILHMEIGRKPTTEFWAWFDKDKKRYMPFALELGRFARRDWKTLQVGFTEEDFKSSPPEYTLWPGRTVDLDFAADETGDLKPRIRLEVLSVHERAAVSPHTFEEAGGRRDGYTIGPLATLAVTAAARAEDGATSTPVEEEWQLTPLMPSRRVFYDPDWQFRLQVDHGPDVATARAALADVDPGRVGWLSIRVVGEGEAAPTRVPVRVGERVQASGGYQIEIVRAVPNLRFDRATETEIVDPRPVSAQFPGNPAVVVRITPPGGHSFEERKVQERLDYEDESIRKSFENSGLVLNFEWDRWGAAGPERFVLHWDERGSAMLLARDGVTASVQPGDELALPGTTKVVARKFFVNARLERNVSLDPAAPAIQGPHFDAAFYSTDPTGVEIQVTTDPGTPIAKVERVLLASTSDGFADEWLSPDRRFYLHYFHNSKVMPFEWRSVLAVHEPDASGKLAPKDIGPEWEREIRVNDYFHYRGYRFFQTNANPDFPSYSGIGVVYDPGIPCVLMGMYLTIVGAILAFVVRPIREAYGQSKAVEMRS